MAETAYQRMNPKDDGTVSAGELTIGTLAQDDLHELGGSYERREGGRGEDSLEARPSVPERNGFATACAKTVLRDFAKHVEDYVASTGANWSYNPPGGIEWTV
jgi:hypothetical protein